MRWMLRSVVCAACSNPTAATLREDVEVAVAALAWEHGYLATCLDEASLRAFVEARIGQAPEDLCVPGVDRSADGWCPG